MQIYDATAAFFASMYSKSDVTNKIMEVFFNGGFGAMAQVLGGWPAGRGVQACPKTRACACAPNLTVFYFAKNTVFSVCDYCHCF